MTLLTIIASIVTGIIVGGWLAMVVASAAMSRSQERMQKKIRYWQAQAWEARVPEDAEPQPTAHDSRPQVLCACNLLMCMQPAVGARPPAVLADVLRFVQHSSANQDLLS